jgi:hypothetical protein
MLCQQREAAQALSRIALVAVLASAFLLSNGVPAAEAADHVTVLGVSQAEEPGQTAVAAAAPSMWHNENVCKFQVVVTA